MHRTGAFDMQSGDRVRYGLDGREGVAVEFTPDGEAIVNFDDGTSQLVKWNHLSKIEDAKDQCHKFYQ